MALDSSIALQGKLPQFDSPLSQMAQLSQVQGLQNQNQLAQYTLAKARRDDEDTIAQRNLLTGAGGDLEAGYNALLKGGYLDRALAIKKSQQEQLKTGSEISKNNADAGKKLQETTEAKRQQAVQDMASFETPADALASLQHHAAKGDIDPQQAQLMAKNIPTDPAQFAKWQVSMLRKLMAPKDQVALTTPDANAQLSANTSLATTGMNNRNALATNAATNATSRANTADTVSATRDGQNKPVWDSERGAFVDPRTGQATMAVGADGKPLGAKDKPLTETQGKATGFAARAQQADKLIASLDYSSAAINSKASVENTPMVGGMLGALVNSTTLSSSDQRAEQAQRDFINAVLRQESGAAIGKDEFTNARKQYFPQPGDDAETLAQKAANRKLAVEALRTQAGPGAKQIDGMIETSNKPPAALKPGMPENKKAMEEAKKLGEMRPPPVPFDIQALLKKHGGG